MQPPGVKLGFCTDLANPSLQLSFILPRPTGEVPDPKNPAVQGLSGERSQVSTAATTTGVPPLLLRTQIRGVVSQCSIETTARASLIKMFLAAWKSRSDSWPQARHRKVLEDPRLWFKRPHEPQVLDVYDSSHTCTILPCSSALERSLCRN